MQNLKEFVKYLPNEIDANEMKAIDTNSSYLGVSKYQLMENAGASVADLAMKTVRQGGNILIVCGIGNNGGDGFVTARHLENKYNVSVVVIGSANMIKSEPALTNYRLVERSPVIKLVHNWKEEIDEEIKNADLIIDAIYGTGFHAPLAGDAKEVIAKINRSGKKIIAIDIPSGVDLDAGKSNGAIDADYTVTFHKMKKSLEKCRKAGRIIVASIGIPIAAELFAGPGDMLIAQHKRGMNSSKKDNGYVLVFGGGSTYHGAPALASNAAYASLAALRSSAGYVVTYVPDQMIDPVRAVSPNIIVKKLNKENMESINRDIEKCDSMAIGMGMGREESSMAMADKIIKSAMRLGKKIVIDADALYAISKIGRLDANVAITPNGHEFSRIYKDAGAGLADKIYNAVDFAKKLGCTVVLKGNETVITDGGRVKVNTTESAALATMGTGDVLSGIIASYMAKEGVFRSAVAGVYLHGRIGDLLHIERGDHIIASDVVETIPKVLHEIEEG